LSTPFACADFSAVYDFMHVFHSELSRCFRKCAARWFSPFGGRTQTCCQNELWSPHAQPSWRSCFHRQSVDHCLVCWVFHVGQLTVQDAKRKSSTKGEGGGKFRTITRIIRLKYKKDKFIKRTCRLVCGLFLPACHLSLSLSVYFISVAIIPY